MDDPLLWSVEPSGQMWRPGDRPRKYHLDRGDSTAKCSPRIFLNSLDHTRPIGFGGAIYADAPAGRLSQLDPEDVCRRCFPEPHDSGTTDAG